MSVRCTPVGPSGVRIVETEVPTTSSYWKILGHCSSGGAGHRCHSEVG